jgi:hypothetical protein
MNEWGCTQMDSWLMCVSHVSMCMRILAASAVLVAHVAASC